MHIKTIFDFFGKLFIPDYCSHEWYLTRVFIINETMFGDICGKFKAFEYTCSKCGKSKVKKIRLC